VFENLLFILGEHESQSDVYLGYRQGSKIFPPGFPIGGGGYVFSKPVMKKLVDEGSKYPNDCRKRDGFMDDMNIAR